MPSTFTNNLGLEKPATGEQAGSWGVTANKSYDFLDVGIDGSLQISLSSQTYSLLTQTGVPSDGRNKVIVWTGTPGAAVTVTIGPNTAQKIYMMQNACGFPIAFRQGTGGDFNLQAGQSAIIYCNGAGATAKVDGANYNPQVNSLLVVGALTVQGAISFAQAATYSQPATFNGTATFNGAAALNGDVTMTLPGVTNSPYDLYYRSPAGKLAPLAVGPVGTVLEVQPNGSLGWSVPGIVVGGSISGSAPYCIYYSNPSNQLSQDALVQINPGYGIGIGLTPSHSLHIGYGRLPQIWLDSNDPTNQARYLIFATNNSLRWALSTPGAGETGGNAGSNLALASYTDGGAFLAWVMSFWRANGNITIGALGDQGAKLAIFASVATQPPLVVRGVASQAYLQVWQASDGSTVASIDGQGNLFVKGGGFLTTQPVTGRLDLYGTVQGHPWGCIHVGKEPSTGGAAGLTGAIAMEYASQATDSIPVGMVRFYVRTQGAAVNFVIQYQYNGRQVFTFVPLSDQDGPAQWYTTH